MKPVLLIYLPVIHAGYLQLFDRWHQKANELWILDSKTLDQFQYLEPEIRALKPEIAAALISKMNLFETVKLAGETQIKQLNKRPFVALDDAVTKRLIEKYKIKPTTTDTAFLRWDEQNVLTNHDVNFDRISTNQQDQKYMNLARLESMQAADWWRQVGSLAVKDNQILFTEHNSHLPLDEIIYSEGDPRDFVPAGTDSHITTVLHSEQAIMTKAALEGVSLKSADLYLTVFPCPMCAKQVAYAGFKRVFFASGHASLDGERVLKNRNVELIYVPLEEEAPASSKQGTH